MARIYNPKDIVLTYDGMQVTGFADDSFITVSKNTDDYSHKVGVKGEVTISVDADDTGTVTISLDQRSPFINIFNRMIKEGKYTNNILRPLTMIDMGENGDDISSEAYITKRGDQDFGRTSGNVDYQFVVMEI